jgi:hypothetical protein
MITQEIIRRPLWSKSMKDVLQDPPIIEDPLEPKTQKVIRRSESSYLSKNTSLALSIDL